MIVTELLFQDELAIQNISGLMHLYLDTVVVEFVLNVIFSKTTSEKMRCVCKEFLNRVYATELLCTGFNVKHCSEL